MDHRVSISLAFLPPTCRDGNVLSVRVTTISPISKSSLRISAFLVLLGAPPLLLGLDAAAAPDGPTTVDVVDSPAALIYERCGRRPGPVDIPKEETVLCERGVGNIRSK